jgi:hypothetical protein
MSKFQRNYKLSILKSHAQGVYEKLTFEDPLVISYPLHIEFVVDKTITSSLNTANINVYNLSLGTREYIYQDKFNIGLINGSITKEYAILEAGYGNQLYQIFNGMITNAYYQRSGSDIITRMECTDSCSDVTSSACSFTVGAGTTKGAFLDQALKSMPNIQRGRIAGANEIFEASYNFTGNTFFQIQKVFGEDKVFIDDGVLNVLGMDDVIVNTITLITSSTGLLGVPQRNNTFLTVDCIFTPELQLGQLIEIQSSINPLFNGQYKIWGLKHSGAISGTHAGQCKTTIQINIGTQAFQEIKE